MVRSTHGVNCTGGCSWNVHVKDGIVGWELQATDYPELEAGLPPYEPRGCQRGISFSWYLYSPLRIKYPYLRGVLTDLWRAAKAEHGDPVEAWASIVEDPAKRKSYQQARGKGGFRRVQLGRGRGDHRRLVDLHHQEVRCRPAGRLLADSGHVDAQFRRRRRASCS